MSNSLLPSLIGLSWDREEIPQFNTSIEKSLNMNELRIAFAETPTRIFKLKYDLLRDDSINNELKQLFGFFLSRAGSFDSFLYQDPMDSIAQDQVFGIGELSRVDFQLSRTFNGQVEEVMNIDSSILISYPGHEYDPSEYVVSSTGGITFDEAPPEGAVLSWSGTYYYRCRFTSDTLTFTEFMRAMWDNKSVEFIGALGVKI